MPDQQLILYNTPDGKGAVVLLAKDGTVWLNQNQLAELFSTSKANISIHISNILKEGELDRDSTVKYYLTVASNGKNYKIAYYSLEMIMAIGFRVRSMRGTQFRQWANANLREYLIKGFVMDDERLKNPDGRPDYFDELFARIRDIRASEKRFYQKVRDLFMLSSDYDATDKATQMFYAEVQNKLLYAVTGHTAAEIVVERADAGKPNMGLTSWKGAVVRKQDITIAKNYLTAKELDKLNRLVVIFLESAELRVQERRDLTMDYWRGNVNRLLELNEQPLLPDAGSISKVAMGSRVMDVYGTFDIRRKEEERLLADEVDLHEIIALEQQLKERR